MLWSMGSRLNTTTSEGGQADSEELPLGPPGKPVMRGIKMKGKSILWGSRSLGADFRDFHPSSIFPRGGGISVATQLRSEGHVVGTR